MSRKLQLGFMLCISYMLFVHGIAFSADKKNMKLLLKAAENGDPIAQNELGVLYVNGDGIPVNYIEAMKWFKKAAEQKDAKAQNNLGVMYLNGDGVPQNYKEAIKWYKKAAAQGHSKAQYNLGIVYEKGQGVPQNYMEAYVWYSLAAAQGHKDAKHNLYVTEPKLTDAQVATSQKRAAELWTTFTKNNK